MPRPENSLCDVGGYEYTAIYVDADATTGAATGISWTDAFTTVQDGLSAANPMPESTVNIFVAEGIYYPDEGEGQSDNWISATFVLTDGVAIYGGFDPDANVDEFGERDWGTYVTVLSGDLAQDDITDPGGVVTSTANIIGSNAYHIVSGVGVSNTATLDGFTITGGQAIGVEPHHDGGGMYNTSGSSPTLANLEFRGNLANHNGGALHNTDRSSPSLTNAIFSNNQAVNNRGGAISNMYDSNPTFTNVVINGNSSDGGGGAMFNRQSSPTLVNVTIAGNHTGTRGGGLYNWETTYPTMTNTILWGNTADVGDNQIYNRDGAAPVITYSDIEGGYNGTGNIDLDPWFENEYNDLHQRANSPVIDAGTNIGCPALDLDGVTRPIGTTCDMGAYEIERMYFIFFPIVFR